MHTTQCLPHTIFRAKWNTVSNQSLCSLLSHTHRYINACALWLSWIIIALSDAIESESERRVRERVRVEERKEERERAKGQRTLQPSPSHSQVTRWVNMHRRLILWFTLCNYTHTYTPSLHTWVSWIDCIAPIALLSQWQRKGVACATVEHFSLTDHYYWPTNFFFASSNIFFIIQSRSNSFFTFSWGSVIFLDCVLFHLIYSDRAIQFIRTQQFICVKSFRFSLFAFLLLLLLLLLLLFFLSLSPSSSLHPLQMIQFHSMWNEFNKTFSINGTDSR